METSSASSRRDDVELPNFDFNLFGEPPSKSAKRVCKFERAGVESYGWTKTFREDQKNNRLVLFQLFEVSHL